MNTQDDSDWDRNVSSFLGLFPNLSHFRLHLADGDNSVEFSYLPEALQMLSLETFELVNCSTTQENLMPLLRCHRATTEQETTLKEIVLEGVDIESGKNGTWNWIKHKLRARVPTCSVVLRNCLVEGTHPMPRMTFWHQIEKFV